MRTKDYTLPYLSLTILFVTLFSALSAIERNKIIVGTVQAIFGVTTIGMALMSSFGFMFICGVYFNVMISVTPFITMCVGIDNDFLLLASWRHTR